jgi:hypothetical protein
MVNYIFPIFCFGLVITGVVIKGLFVALEMNPSDVRDEDAAGGTAITDQLLSVLSKPQERHSPDLLRRPEPHNPTR